MGRVQAADPAISRAVEHDDHRHHVLSRRQRRPDPGLHHRADPAGRGERRRDRHSGRHLDPERQHGHAQSQARRRSRPGDDRRAVEDRPGEEHPAARGERLRRHQADGRGLCADVSLLQLEGDELVPDQRLSQPRGAAEAANHQRRGQRADPRRPDLRHAHLARSRPHGLARRDAARRAARACQQQLHLGARPGEGRLRADQYRRQDLARRSCRVRAPSGDGPRRFAGAPERHRRDRARAAKRGFLLGVRRAEGGVHRRLCHADRQPADGDHRRAQGVPRDPARAAARARRRDRLRRHQFHSRLSVGGDEDARRSGAHRHRGDLPLPRQSPLDHHPDRHHPAVADRRARRAGGARLLDQPHDAARPRARHRARGRRRHRRGGEHLPAYRGGEAPARSGAARRARDRLSGHRHDHHLGGGVRADRLRLGADRHSVPRVCLHAWRAR